MHKTSVMDHDIRMCPSPFYRFWHEVLVLLATFVILSIASDSSHCASFRPNELTSRENTLTLIDLSVIGNSAAEYFTSKDTWNRSGIWTVNSECQLKICDNVYLTGRCKSVNEGSQSIEKWLSAKCECSKTCERSEIHLKRSVCARAYLNDERSEDDCHSQYIELEPTHSSVFSDVWGDDVSSLLLRPGCTLNSYEEEAFEGELKTSVNEGLQNEILEWEGPLGSYECDCPTYIPVERGADAPEVANPPLIDIGLTLDDVATSFAESDFSHPGLLAALTSQGRGRSSKNAYILLLGTSGAGKSSCINILLGQRNLTVTGDQISTTSEIFEFRIKFPVAELGIKNSELRIIDTPGLGDTRGVENDALFLASLEDYLNRHEELSYRMPNLVLIFHKFTDNRFYGENARFVRMIRGLNILRERISDAKFSNVLFVFSHFCSEVNQLQRDPLVKLLKFKEVINMFSLFPEPIVMAVAENKPKDNDLPMRMGQYELPNHEYFPLNLIQKFDMITRNGDDKIGNALIKTALTSSLDLSEDLAVDAVRHYLVSSSHSGVGRYLDSLNTNSYMMATTEVSKLLEQAFEQMNTTLKTRFPESLEKLQRYLNLRNIKSKSDLPQTSIAILKLLKGLPENEVYDHLLETGLNIKAPAFPHNVRVGYGYNVFRDSPLSSSPFLLDEMKISNIGFMIPKVILSLKNDTSNSPENQLKVFDTKKMYYDHKMKELFGDEMMTKVNNSEIFAGVTASIKDGFCVKDISCAGGAMCSFVATRFYQKFQFHLQSDASPSAAFFEKINSLPPFNQHNHESVDGWNEFFNDYGTHIIKSAVGGGKIDFHFSINTAAVNQAFAKVVKVLELVEDPLDVIMKYRVAPKTVFNEAKAISHSLVFHGGNPTYHVTDLSNLSLEEARKIIENWKQTLDFYPAVFPNKIEPMINALGNNLDQESLTKITDAFLHLINSSLKYVAPPPPTPDPKVLEEMERKRREQEEEMKRLQELQRQEEEAEKERQRQAQRELERLEEEKRKAEEKRKRLAEEAEKQRQREARELQEFLNRIAEEQRRRDEEEAERQRNEYLQIQLAIQREHERLERIRNQPPPVVYRKRNSCLKRGTRILLADFSEKPVESLEIGDMLLDKDLTPTKVLGLSYEFLLDQTFYGFDNKTFFFTDSHLLVGPSPSSEIDYQLYTYSTERLFAQNPLLEYLNIHQFSAHEPTKLYHFDRNFDKAPVEKSVRVYQDPKTHDQETLIYFLQVDNPSGTYIAEGFVCRHEVPPMEYWPNTMSALFSLFDSPGLKMVAEMQYSIETIHLIDKVSDDVKLSVWRVFEKYFDLSTLKGETETGDKCEKLTLQDFDLEEVVGKIFGNPTLAALGMEIYGGSGKIISQYLDNPILNLSNCTISRIQSSLFYEMGQEIEISLRKHYQTWETKF